MKETEMKRMFLSVIVIAFLIMACDATSIVPQEPLPTVAVLPQPSLTPYPTQPVPTRYPTQVPPVPMVVPTLSHQHTPSALGAYDHTFETALLNNDFYDDGWVCDTPCHSYTYSGSTVYLSAFSFADGTMAMFAGIGDDYDMTFTGEILGYVFLEAFGYNSVTWLTDHMEASVYENQYGSFNGHAAVMSVEYTDGNAILVITID
jgi:hypothetical protein